MCGIAGFSWKDNKLVEKMMAQLVHRGPDQFGFYCDSSVSLGHRRLNILDLSLNGRQPMQNEEGSLQLVFNGEIFNFVQLRQELITKGHGFFSQTDSEVLVHLYEEHGFGLLDKLNGQFAFCVYDKQKQILFLARDRIGILPLYYYYKNGQFIFASELKAILSAHVPREIDPKGVTLYFQFGYIPSPYCIFKDIFKLKPAHYLVFDLKSKQIQCCERYWNISFGGHPGGSHKLESTIKSLLDDATRIRLQADVAVGAFLSGGVDSSIIVSHILKYKRPLKTFSVKFARKKFDESSYARMISRLFKTDHHEIHFSSQDLRELIPIIISCVDEPFADYSVFPQYLVAKKAREYVTVVLAGDGGDELFAGYKRYQYFPLVRFICCLPVILKKTVSGLLRFLHHIYPRYAITKLIDLMSLGQQPDVNLYQRFFEKMTRQDVARLLKGCVEFVGLGRDLRVKEGLNALLEYDIVTYLEGDILAKVDRSAMASSLETRPPFLDHRLVELCHTIPSAIKLKKGSGKWILKEAYRGIIPQLILRRKKRGFSVPIQYYLRHDFRDLVDQYVYNYKGHNLFDISFLQNLEATDKMQYTWRVFWMVIMFNLWHEKYVAQKGNE